MCLRLGPDGSIHPISSAQTRGMRQQGHFALLVPVVSLRVVCLEDSLGRAEVRLHQWTGQDEGFQAQEGKTKYHR